MFFIKKLIEAMIFPPGIVIIALLLIVLVAVLGEKYKDSIKGKLVKKRINSIIIILSISSAVFLYLFSIQPVSNLLLSPLQKAYPLPSAVSVAKFKPDAIAVLGSGAYNKNTLDGDSLNRLYAGFKLYKRYKIPIIVSGGYAASTVSVAKVMRNILLEIGVPKSYVITEDESNDTFENALYVLKICKRRNFKRVILVTSAYHMPRAMFLFNELKGGIKIIPYPTDFKTDKHYNIYGYFPQLGNLTISEEAMHEYIGYFYAIIKGKKHGSRAATGR